MRFQNPPTTVLTLEQLADMLQISAPMAERLVAFHELPHVIIAGSPRYLGSTVLNWLETASAPGGIELSPPAPPEPKAPQLPPVSVHALPPLGPNEVPWLDSHLMTALASGAADPSRNLDRLRLRDALLELNGELLPVMTRLSGGRLHPDPHEQTRTSPWRLEGDGARPITVMSIAWGAGPTGTPQFQDRPRVQIELMDGLLRIALELEGQRIALTRAEVDALEATGFAVDYEDPEAPSADGIARIYKLEAAGVSAQAVAAALGKDLEPLIKIWNTIAPRG